MNMKNYNQLNAVYKNIKNSLGELPEKKADHISHHLVEIYAEVELLSTLFAELSNSPSSEILKDIESIVGTHWSYHISRLNSEGFGDKV